MQIGQIVPVDGRGYGHHMKAGGPQIIGLTGKLDVAVRKVGGFEFLARVLMPLHLRHPLFLDVETHHLKMTGQFQGNGQSHITQSRSEERRVGKESRSRWERYTEE